MKYKIGDKVRIKSIDWHNENKDEYGNIDCGTMPFMSHMTKFCNKIVTISDIDSEDEYYEIEEDGTANGWTDEMIEGLAEEENNDCEKCGLIRNSTGCLFMDNCPHNKQKNIIVIPEDYIIKDENGNIINATKIVLEKKGKGYPKTFVDCCAILYPNDNFQIVSQRVKGHKGDLLFRFQKLLICRDAYWKIAGEEMGLGKPWEPDYSGTFEHGTPIKYVIYNIGTHIVKERKSSPNHILSFPTEEMRDAFYEAFKEEIEICKELL